MFVLPRIYSDIRYRESENIFIYIKFDLDEFESNFRLSLMRQLMEVRRKVFEVSFIPFSLLFSFLFHLYMWSVH